MRDGWPVGRMRAALGAAGAVGRLVRWAGLGAWPARRVAGLLVLSAAWLGGQGPVGAQEAEGEGAAEPKSVAEVRISGLSGTLTYGGSDSFR